VAKRYKYHPAPTVTPPMMVYLEHTEYIEREKNLETATWELPVTKVIVQQMKHREQRRKYHLNGIPVLHELSSKRSRHSCKSRPLGDGFGRKY
jgi:hypothetical protein